MKTKAELYVTRTVSFSAKKSIHTFLSVFGISFSDSSKVRKDSYMLELFARLKFLHTSARLRWSPSVCSAQFELSHHADLFSTNRSGLSYLLSRYYTRSELVFRIGVFLALSPSLS